MRYKYRIDRSTNMTVMFAQTHLRDKDAERVKMPPIKTLDKHILQAMRHYCMRWLLLTGTNWVDCTYIQENLDQVMVKNREMDEETIDGITSACRNYGLISFHYGRDYKDLKLNKKAVKFINMDIFEER